MDAYAIYFVGCGLTGLSAIVLCLLLLKIQPKPPAVAAADEPSGAS